MPDRDRDRSSGSSWVESIRVSTVVSDIAICTLFFALAKIRAVDGVALGTLIGMWLGHRFGQGNAKRVIEAQERATAAVVSSVRPPPMPRSTQQGDDQ